MALIDQRILIDAPPESVWQVLSDPNRLVSWHAGYKNVAVLTTYAVGVGARRRCTLSSGKDVIEEITAWVEGLGYEYALVNGGPGIRRLQSRIRLQAQPDGTSVQWTIQYQPKGLLGGLRSRLRGRRRMVAMMASSLRELRRQVDALGVRMTDIDRAKVSIRQRLNADQRAQYQRRFAPPPGVEQILEQGALAEPPVQPDPPVEDPRATGNMMLPVSEPSFVADLTRDSRDEEATYSHTADTEPKPPPGLREAIAAQQKGEGAAGTSETVGGDIPDYMRPTPARGIRSVKSDVTPPVVETPRQPELPFSPPAAEPESAPETVAPGAPAPPEISLAAVPQSPAEVRPTPVEDTPSRGLPVVPPPSPAELAPPVEHRSDDPMPRPSAAPVRPAPVSESQRATPPRGFPAVRPSAASDDTPSAHGRPPQTPQTDSGEMSIWEAFGMPRPSDQDSKALDELMEALEARERAARLVNRRRGRSGAAVRRTSTALGLSLRLTRRRVRVRTGRTLDSDQDR